MRGSVSKNDILLKLYKLKNKLYSKDYHNWNQDQYDAADTMLNEIFDLLSEYAR
jgi:hypothetical protein